MYPLGECLVGFELVAPTLLLLVMQISHQRQIIEPLKLSSFISHCFIRGLFALAIALVCLHSRFHIAKSVRTCDCIGLFTIAISYCEICSHLRLRLRLFTIATSYCNTCSQMRLFVYVYNCDLDLLKCYRMQIIFELYCRQIFHSLGKDQYNCIKQLIFTQRTHS